MGVSFFPCSTTSNCFLVNCHVDMLLIPRLSYCQNHSSSIKVLYRIKNFELILQQVVLSCGAKNNKNLSISIECILF
jgi:hypothetical protein